VYAAVADRRARLNIRVRWGRLNLEQVGTETLREKYATSARLRPVLTAAD